MDKNIPILPKLKFPVEINGKVIRILEGTPVGWDSVGGRLKAIVKTEHDGTWQCDPTTLIIEEH